jgi:hypothetical protein
MKDNTITKTMVQEWFAKNVEKTRNPMGPQGKNSFVAPYKGYEYQMDLFFINDLGKKQEYEGGFVMIDIFTKYAVVIPIEAKNKFQLSLALSEALKKMKEAQDVDKPKIIYSDDERAWSVGDIPPYLKEHNIKHYITRNHAQFAERFIRTYKAMLYKRIDSKKREMVQDFKTEKKAKPLDEDENEDEDEYEEPQWHLFNHQILLTYNNLQIHSATKMTPKDAIKTTNSIDVKTNLELKARKNRMYPPLAIGEEVRIMRKKKIGEKERTSIFGQEKYKVVSIDRELGQKYYTTDQGSRQYTRGELLKV